MAASFEIMGDALLTNKRELAVELYNSSKLCYQKASEQPSLYIENIEYKISHGFVCFDHDIEKYYRDTPSLQELLEWMNEVQVDNCRKEIKIISG